MGYPNSPEFTHAELLCIGVAVEKYRSEIRVKRALPTPNMDSILQKLRVYLRVEAELEAVGL